MVSVVLPFYDRAPIAFERGVGTKLFTSDGKRYLDFSSGVGVNGLGHCHPRLVEALCEQAHKFWHSSNLYEVPGQERLAARLTQNSFAHSVFFCNSGMESTEAAIKIIRRYQFETGHPERYRIICAQNAFHGRSLATLAAGGQYKHLHGFGPIVEGFDHVPFNDLPAMRQAINSKTAGILIEPIQGEGGIYVATPEYLEGLRTLCDEFNLVLAFDEIQTGMGRTGKLFAHQHTHITPDVMCIAKALGGGYPIGATMVNESIARAMPTGSHGSTFGGNPLGMAVAWEVLDIMLEPHFLETVRHRADSLHLHLARLSTKYPHIITEVRGMGLMIGLQCGGSNHDLRDKLLAKGLLTVAGGGNSLRLLPPLIISPEDSDEAISILEAVCQQG